MWLAVPRTAASILYCTHTRTLPSYALLRTCVPRVSRPQMGSEWRIESCHSYERLTNSPNAKQVHDLSVDSLMMLDHVSVHWSRSKFTFIECRIRSWTKSQLRLLMRFLDLSPANPADLIPSTLAPPSHHSLALPPYLVLSARDTSRARRGTSYEHCTVTPVLVSHIRYSTVDGSKYALFALPPSPVKPRIRISGPPPLRLGALTLSFRSTDGRCCELAIPLRAATAPSQFICKTCNAPDTHRPCNPSLSFQIHPHPCLRRLPSTTFICSPSRLNNSCSQYR